MAVMDGISTARRGSISLFERRIACHAKLGRCLLSRIGANLGENVKPQRLRWEKGAETNPELGLPAGLLMSRKRSHHTSGNAKQPVVISAGGTAESLNPPGERVDARVHKLRLTHVLKLLPEEFHELAQHLRQRIFSVVLLVTHDYLDP